MPLPRYATAPVTRAGDPIRLQRHFAMAALLLRWRRDRVSTLVMAAVWCATAFVAAAVLATAAARTATVLLDVLARHAMPLALVVLVLSLSAQQRFGLRLLRRWRLGWLAALPGTGAAVPGQLALQLGMHAAAVGLALLLLPVLLLAFVAGPFAAARSLLPDWPVAVAMPALAAPITWLRLRRRGAAQLLQVARHRRAQAPAPAAFPAPLRWQWAEIVRELRGRYGAWMVLPWLLMLPAGLSPAATLLALAGALLVAAMLTAWTIALRTIPQAAALLRATPLPPLAFLRSLLALPLAIAVVSSAAACILVLGAGTLVAVAVAGTLLGAALLHTAVVAAGRHRPRWIAPALVLHVGLVLAAALAFAPLVLPVLGVQLWHLGRKALRP